ncbi:hypothetical protein [Engelhardtia mirabilis]|uniref:hypothetical protein n=1 Tax=Engelhardtia mirabilis TaxID=2528011 RepID=UPI0011A19342
MALASSGADGLATFGLRPPGHYIVDVDHDRLGSLVGMDLTVVGDGDELDWHPSAVPCVELRSDASIVLRFHDGRHALAGLAVWLRAFPDGPWITTLRHTDAEGWLRVGGLAPGTVQVEIAELGWWPAPIRVEALPADIARATPPPAVRMVGRGRLELSVRGSFDRDVDVNLWAEGLGDLDAWLRSGLVRVSTADGRPDRCGRLVLEGLPVTRVSWSVCATVGTGTGISRSGVVQVTSCSVTCLTVELGDADAVDLGNGRARLDVRSGGVECELGRRGEPGFVCATEGNVGVARGLVTATTRGVVEAGVRGAIGRT